MKPLVIAVAGKACVGKDTFADGLIQMGFRRIALADNLKAMCQLIFGISPWHTDTQEGKIAELNPVIQLTNEDFWRVVKYMMVTHSDLDIPDSQIEWLERQLPQTIRTTRQLLQFVGTEFCRFALSCYHIDVLLQKIQREAGVAGWVVTDCRFPDERRAFKEKAGASVVLIHRPGFDEAPATHASELSLGLDSDYQYVIDNVGTIEELHRKASELLVKIQFHKCIENTTGTWRMPIEEETK